ncbi:hypothetical protein [uncultured Kriegella sp.]|uniref:hypothetical protein n=1 Tax=uncultured Kriegella sp. TaxID=1798910 RepID=UPI0030DD7187|tara:strand:- start:119082 stop:124436 length:5355 start_codon:yes stop_codon:yes gene_type:complete
MSDNKYSRREFIKNSSLVALGNFNLPPIALSEFFFEENFNLKAPLSPDLILNLVRSSDLLNVQIEFFNVYVKGNFVHRLIQDQESFIRVILPSQHIAEELVLNSSKLNKKFSFLSGKSVLAFRWVSPKDKLKLNPKNILNWNDNFQLVSLGDFLTDVIDSDPNSNQDRFKKTRVEDLSIFQIEDSKNQKLIFNQHGKASKFWPITNLEVPYKMYLSPIPPSFENDSGDKTKTLRSLGSFVFDSNSSTILKKGKRNSLKFRIVKIWENDLQFQDLLGQKTSARFKVIGINKDEENAEPNEPENCECENRTIELLPSPIHRKELNELTMLPEWDRDVASEPFKISAIGTSANLKYYNEYPTKNTSIVGWEQEIKYARDNKVSITFRAIDIFTGLKILVSIKAERKFTGGKSYLLKRYYLDFMEREKSYEHGHAIGIMTWSKITALSNGTYFNPLKPSSENWYHVQSENNSENPDNPRDYRELNDLTFEYIGIDKSGNEHRFSSKMIFIPAESYMIKSGKYCYQPDCSLPAVPYGPKKEVHIKHLGGLELKNLHVDAEDGAFSISERSYSFTLKKVFNDQEDLKKKFNDIANILGKTENRVVHYSFRPNSEITYAKLERLKQNKDEVLGSITQTSENSNFYTASQFFLPLSNKSLYERGRYSGDDCFNEKYPLIPFLHHAKIIVSQIDQIEGISSLRTVGLAKSYFKFKEDNSKRGEKTEEFRDENPARLIFKFIENNPKLVDKINTSILTPIEQKEEPLENFFAKNYREAGGMVNPGIKISHLSVLDEGVIYDESHNTQFQKGSNYFENNKAERTRESGSIIISPPVQTISIFDGLDASICGISLIDILETSLPIEQIPKFNFVKDIEGTFEKIESLVNNLEDVYSTSKQQYENAKLLLEETRENISDYESRIKDLELSETLSWLKSLKNYFNEINSLNQLEIFLENEYESVQNGISSYVKQILPYEEKIYQDTCCPENEIKFIFNELSSQINTELDESSVLNLVSILFGFSELNHKQILEIARIRFLESIVQNPDSWEQLAQFIKIIENASQIFSEKQKKYDTFLKALYVVAQFCPKFVKAKKNQALQTWESIFRKVENANFDGINNIKPEEYRKRLEGWIKQSENILNSYQQFRTIFKLFNFGHYKFEARRLNLKNFDLGIQEELEKRLVEQYFNSIEKIEIQQADFPNKHAALDYIQKEIKKLNGINNLLSNYEIHIKTFDKIIESNEALDLFDISDIVEENLQNLKNLLVTEKAKFRKLENEIRNFGKNLLNDFDALRDEYSKKLADLEFGGPEYQRIKTRLKEIDELKSKLSEASKQSLNYQFTTRNFVRNEVGPVEFIPSRITELEVDVQYNIEFDVSEYNQSPKIANQTFHTKTKLNDFDINFLKLITIRFEKVSFISGTDLKDDFDVKIRHVEFEGVLAFVQAFQKYLKTVNKNLIFHVDSSGASIGFAIPLPDIPAGPFLFFNMNFAALLTLPFDSNKAMRFRFGLGSPYSKFGLTYLAFGGQGYFNIIVEPKDGIVAMEVVLEFGAIFNLNIAGIVKGTAYLVGGIYIYKSKKPEEEQSVIKGYILCVGRFNIIGLFSAAITFYLGLESKGNGLHGICTVRVTKRFSRFFKVSVQCTMEKQIDGTKKQQHSAEEANPDPEISFIEGNLFRNMNSILPTTNELYITFKSNKGNSEHEFDIGLKNLETAEQFMFNKTIEEDPDRQHKIICFSRENGFNGIDNWDGYSLVLFKKSKVTGIYESEKIIYNAQNGKSGGSGNIDINEEILAADIDYYASYC